MLSPRPYQLSSKDSNILLCLFGLGWIPLRSTVGLDDEGSSLVLRQLHIRNIAIELPCILAYELVALPDLILD